MKNSITIRKSTSILYRVRKTFQGGEDVYYFRLKGPLTTGQWDCLLDWVGEHTLGGHNYGYTVTATKSVRKNIPRKKLLKPPVENF